jgi:hypothetical protein
MHRKMDKTIHGNCACIQAAFSACRTKLSGKTLEPYSKEVKF